MQMNLNAMFLQKDLIVMITSNILMNRDRILSNGRLLDNLSGMTG